MDISVLVTEEQLQTDLIEHLRARRIPEKYFYWSPLSAKAWLALCRSAAYRNYERSMEVLRREAGEIARLARPATSWIGLGCGQGAKDLVVLEAIAAELPARDIPFFTALDTSQWLIELALEAAAEAGLPARGLKADLGVTEHLRAGADAAPGRPRIFALLGNTLGAIRYREFLADLGSLMKEADIFLVDGEIYEAESVAAGYLNDENLRFATSPLLTIGLSRDDGELIFETHSDPLGLDGMYLLRKHFRLTRDVMLSVAGVDLPFHKGQRLEMGYSCKYAPEAFTALLARSGGMEVEQSFTSDDGRFLVAVARRYRV